MKFFCTKENLLNGVQVVQKAVASKSTIPILGGMHITAGNDCVELEATDYELGIRYCFPAQVAQTGSTVLAAKYFSELVRRLPADTATFTLDGDTCLLESGQARYNFVTMPAADYPELPKIESARSITLPENLLKNMIRQTAFACSTDETRPVFTGVLMEMDTSAVTFVATNTHRLACRSGNIEGQYEQPASIIIPARAISELGRILSNDSEKPVSISLSKSRVVFSFDAVYMISSLIEGQFPNWRQVVPEKYNTRVTVATDALLAAIERASLMAREGDYNVIKLAIDQNALVITANNPDVGQVYEHLAAEVAGDPLTIALNARYITDVLKVIDSPGVYVEFTTPLTPCCIKPVEQDNYKYIVTPVRTN